MTGHIEVALPFWLDRPDEEALDIALASRAAGFDTLWVGEMATYDAFALATAVGHRAPGVRLKIGPLALGVRSPVALALGASSVASLTGCEVDIALGASSRRSWRAGTAARGRTTPNACARPSSV